MHDAGVFQQGNMLPNTAGTRICTAVLEATELKAHIWHRYMPSKLNMHCSNAPAGYQAITRV